MRTNAKRIGVVLAFGVLAGCSDSTGSGSEGVFSFDYTGTVNGSYVARGGRDVGGSMPREDYAEAITGIRFGVHAGVVHGDGTASLAILETGPPLARGTYPVCLPNTPGQPPCYDLRIFFRDNDSPSVGPGEHWFMGGTGEVIVTEVTERRMRGTFSATLGERITGSGSITVRDGRFDVAIREEAGPI